MLPVAFAVAVPFATVQPAGDDDEILTAGVIVVVAIVTEVVVVHPLLSVILTL